MNGESIKEVPFVKYLGHVISADMKDYLDRDNVDNYMHKAMLLLVVFICARTMSKLLFFAPIVGGNTRLTPSGNYI